MNLRCGQEHVAWKWLLYLQGHVPRKAAVRKLGAPCMCVLQWDWIQQLCDLVTTIPTLSIHTELRESRAESQSTIWAQTHDSEHSAFHCVTHLGRTKQWLLAPCCSDPIRSRLANWTSQAKIPEPAGTTNCATSEHWVHICWNDLLADRLLTCHFFFLFQTRSPYVALAIWNSFGRPGCPQTHRDLSPQCWD